MTTFVGHGGVGEPGGNIKSCAGGCGDEQEFPASFGNTPYWCESCIDREAAKARTEMGLLPPVAPATDPAPQIVPDDAVQRSRAAELAETLAADRAAIDVQREDELARRAQQAEHRIALADVAERAAAAKRARRERTRDAAEAEALGALYRRAARSGARAHIRTQIMGSAEMRALRVARVRAATLIAGVPILAAFAAWSTAGVQAGVIRLLGLDHGSAGWWAAWAMEPALIAVVGLIIIGRAVLRSAGGDTDRRADMVEWTALGTSLALNIAGGWDTSLAELEALGAALAHSVGPIGAAGTAFLIGLFDGYVATARPWVGAPRLADLDLSLPVLDESRRAVEPGGPTHLAGPTQNGDESARRARPVPAATSRTGTTKVSLPPASRNPAGTVDRTVRPGQPGRGSNAKAESRPVRDGGGDGLAARMREYAQKKLAAGEQITGADLDREFGTNDYGRRILRELTSGGEPR